MQLQSPHVASHVPHSVIQLRVLLYLVPPASPENDVAIATGLRVWYVAFMTSLLIRRRFGAATATAVSSSNMAILSRAVGEQR